MKKYVNAVLLAALGCTVLSGCGKSAAKPQETTETVAAETNAESDAEPGTEAEAVSPEGMARNNLTGEWISADAAAKRPLALMIENTREAWPHYGIENADIVYECPVEGSITRYMALFQDYSGMDRIGNVRSCRPYYVDFASEYDAIYAHFGECIFAFDILEKIDDLDALEGQVENLAFYRTSDMNAPHNAYVSADGIDAAIASKGYSTTMADGFGEHYNFANDDETVSLDNGYDAVVVEPGYRIDKPWFVYNPSDGLYYRYAFGSKEKDAVTGDQLAYNNIILQGVNYTMYTGSGTQFDDKYLNIDCYSGGTGQYVTNGKAIDITWSKDSLTSPTRYFDADGNEIKVNQGKTWVCVVLNEDADRVHFYGSEDEFNNRSAE